VRKKKGNPSRTPPYSGVNGAPESTKKGGREESPTLVINVFCPRRNPASEEGKGKGEQATSLEHHHDIGGGNLRDDPEKGRGGGRGPTFFSAFYLLCFPLAPDVMIWSERGGGPSPSPSAPFSTCSNAKEEGKGGGGGGTPHSFLFHLSISIIGPLEVGWGGRGGKHPVLQLILSPDLKKEKGELLPSNLPFWRDPTRGGESLPFSIVVYLLRCGRRRLLSAAFTAGASF